MSLLNYTKIRHDRYHKVLVADMHLHHLPTWRFEWCQELVESLLQLGDDLVSQPDLVLLGDVFELRNRVDAKVANLFIRLVLSWPGRVLWVVGQHDSFIPGAATFTALNGVDGVTVIDSEVYHEHEEGASNYYVPYFRDQDHYLAALDTIPDGATVFTHMPVAEALIGKGDASLGHISAKEFARFEKTWAGDIHVANKYGRLEYVGAPGQMDWRDEGVQGRIILLDWEYKSLPILVKHPKHIKLASRAAIRMFKGNPNGCIVKVVDTQSPGQHDLERLKHMAGVINVSVDIPVTSVDAMNSAMECDQTDEEVLIAYLNKNCKLSETLMELALVEGKSILAEVT